jgi:hypothetical protein
MLEKMFGVCNVVYQYGTGTELVLLEKFAYLSLDLDLDPDPHASKMPGLDPR